MLKLYAADYRNTDERRAKCRPRSPQMGSAFGVSLLEYAVRDTWGIDLPEISPPGGKPYFLHEPEKHFCISHSKTHILVALSDRPVGADVETRREISEESRRMLMDDTEDENFDFFQLWCLRESVFKLNGAGNLREILRFRKEDGRIIGPDPKIEYALIEDVEGCAGAVCQQGEFTMPELQWVDIEKLCT